MGSSGREGSKTRIEPVVGAEWEVVAERHCGVCVFPVLGRMMEG
jgi:hypothetical protein